MMDRYRLVVLFGGQSAEHDVSRVTARHVLAAASRDRYEIDAIGITRDGTWVRSEELGESAAATARDLPAALAVTGAEVVPSEVITDRSLRTVVLPLLHGPMGEDGTMQGLLDIAGVPYVGAGVLGSALCMDKAMTKRAAESFSIPQAAWRSVHADDVNAQLSKQLIESLGDTTFVKPANMGSSVGVTKASGHDELTAALERAARYDEWLVVEEAVDAREIEVGVLGNRHLDASVPGEIVPGDTFYSYDDKYHDGVAQTLVPAALTAEQTAEVQGLACHAAEALRVQGLARVDFFFEEEGRGFLLNEINTMPGFTPISMFPKLWAASGLDYPALIDRLVDLAIARHDKRQMHRSTEH